MGITFKTLTACILAVMLSSVGVMAQGGCISRQVISPAAPVGNGQPAAGAAVRVCTSTASGTPCSPIAPTIYSDAALTHQISNPLTTDVNGIYYFCAATGSYVIQETLVGGTVYSYVGTASINSSSVGITGGTISGVTITGGSINSTPIGGTTPSTGAFTTLTSTGGAINGSVGATTPSTGSFTTLNATGSASLGAVTATSINNTPVGNSVPSTGAFTTLSSTGVTSFPGVSMSGALTLAEITSPLGSAANDIIWGDSSSHRLKVNSNNGGTGTLALFTDNLGVFAAGGSISPNLLSMVETTAPGGLLGSDLLWADSTAHRFKMGNNNVAADVVVGAATTDTLTNKTISGGTITGTIAGNPTFSGTVTFSGGLTFSSITTASINNILFADQYANVQAAINACQSLSGKSPTSGNTNGCTIFATSASTNLALGTIDPGSNNIPVTIYLGPMDYTADHIVLRQGLRIIGSGQTTSITSVGLNSQPLFVVPQVNNNAVYGVLLEDFRTFGASGNTSQDGMLIDVSALTTSQWSYSRVVGVQFYNFKGSSIHLKGRTDAATSAIQFLWFEGVVATRPSGGTAPILNMTGYNAQITFQSCEFDGQASDGLDNIYLGTTGNAQPLTVFFHDTTSQNGGTDFHFGGVQNVYVDGLHSENTPTIVNVTADGTAGATSNNNIVVRQSYVAGNSGTNAIVADSDANSTVNFSDNSLNVATNIVSGVAQNRISYCNNRNTSVNTSGIVCRDASTTVGGLPAASSINAGAHYVVSDSTTISSEGQACVGGGSTVALAFSNGSSWKCF